jgi:hypothetical protein
MKNILVLVLSLIAALNSAQQTPHRTGAVKGEAVVVTKSGEIKPALFADVYLLNCTDKTEPSGSNICIVCLLQSIEIIHNDSNRLKSDHQYAEDSVAHSGALRVLTDRSALAYTMSARVTGKDLKSVLSSTKTDGSGKFEFRNLDRRKSYRVLVFGQAGSFDCNWESKSFTISPEGTTSITLHEPKVCARVE